MKGCKATTILTLALLMTLAAQSNGQEPPDLGAIAAIQRSVVEAVDRAEASVVAIARVRRERREGEFPPPGRPDPFGRERAWIGEVQPTDPDFVPNQFASGVVVDPRGLILTAAHVLAEDSEYYVTTAGRKTYRAWVKAADPRSDLAVLAIDATDLVPIRWGDASKLRKGQFVVALGNPHGIARDGQASVSWGIVANLHRKAPPIPSEAESSRRPTIHHFGTLIQTDARLNLGTSGGALLNLQGEMVGLITALAAAPGVVGSAGYAYPVDEMFRRALGSLKQGREVEYGLLGVHPADLSVRDILEKNLSGTRVYAVLPGTPAERAGLKRGDRITEVDGVEIIDADGLVRQVGRLPPGATTRLQVVGEDRSREVRIQVTKFPVRGKKVVTNPPPLWRGMQVDYASVYLDADGRGILGQVAFDEAVLVTTVEEESLSARGGLRLGEMITHVESRPVGTPEAFRRLVAQRNGTIRLRVLSGEPATQRVCTIASEP